MQSEDEKMRNGIHIIKSGFSEDFDFAGNQPRLHNLDNGDYTRNFVITDLQLIPQNNSRSGGNQDDLGGSTVFFVAATTREGAIPMSAVGGDLTLGSFDLRLQDNRQIAWGVVAPARGYQNVIVDPAHIIVEDLYVNCYSFSSAGTLQSADYNIGYMITLESITESGSQGLLNQAQLSAVE